jgi:hypothetical protein
MSARVPRIGNVGFVTRTQHSSIREAMIGKNFVNGWKLVDIWQKTDSEGQELKK